MEDFPLTPTITRAFPLPCLITTSYDFSSTKTAVLCGRTGGSSYSIFMGLRINSHKDSINWYIPMVSIAVDSPCLLLGIFVLLSQTAHAWGLNHAKIHILSWNKLQLFTNKNRNSKAWFKSFCWSAFAFFLWFPRVSQRFFPRFRSNPKAKSQVSATRWALCLACCVLHLAILA